MNIKCRPIFKSIFLLLLIICCQTGFSQIENINAIENTQTVNVFSKDTSGIFYIIVPMGNLSIEDGVREIKSIIDEKGLFGIRVDEFKIEDFRLGYFPYIIIRRFINQDAAKSLIKIVNENAKLSKDRSMAISQVNYRKFLKRKDIEEYRVFIGK